MSKNHNWVFMDAGDTFIYGYPTLFDAVQDCWKDVGDRIEKSDVKKVVNQFLKENPRNDYHTQEKFEEYLRSLYSHIFSSLKFPGDHQKYNDELWNVWQTGKHLRLFDDVLPALQLLKEQDYSLGIITNWDTSFEKTLERLQVNHLFDVQVVSCIEEIGKPDPAIFEIAINRANTSFEQCWYIGDHPVYDIEPALKLGMKTIRVDYYQKTKDTNIEHQYVNSFSLAVHQILHHKT